MSDRLLVPHPLAIDHEEDGGEMPDLAILREFGALIYRSNSASDGEMGENYIHGQVYARDISGKVEIFANYTPNEMGFAEVSTHTARAGATIALNETRVDDIDGCPGEVDYRYMEDTKDLCVEGASGDVVIVINKFVRDLVIFNITGTLRIWSRKFHGRVYSSKVTGWIKIWSPQTGPKKNGDLEMPTESPLDDRMLSENEIRAVVLGQGDYEILPDIMSDTDIALLDAAALECNIELAFEPGKGRHLVRVFTKFNGAIASTRTDLAGFTLKKWVLSTTALFLMLLFCFYLFRAFPQLAV